MRIGYYQFAPEFGNTEKNTEKLAAVLAEAEADLIVAPELATSGYLFTSREELFACAEPVPGPSTEKLTAAAGKSGCAIVAGIAELKGNKVYNSAVFITPDGVEYVYRKVHLFNGEKLYFTRGGGLDVMDYRGVKLGLLVCFDHMFPEAARTLALKGAEIICHPSNLVLPELGQLTTRVRAIENKIFWVLANRHGRENRGGKKLRYTGCSRIVSPSGKILSSAPESEDRLGIVEIDPEHARSKKIADLNDLFKDRRTDIYELSSL